MYQTATKPQLRPKSVHSGTTCPVTIATNTQSDGLHRKSILLKWVRYMPLPQTCARTKPKRQVQKSQGRLNFRGYPCCLDPLRTERDSYICRLAKWQAESQTFANLMKCYCAVIKLHLVLCIDGGFRGCNVQVLLRIRSLQRSGLLQHLRSLFSACITFEHLQCQGVFNQTHGRTGQ